MEVTIFIIKNFKWVRNAPVVLPLNISRKGIWLSYQSVSLWFLDTENNRISYMVKSKYEYWKEMIFFFFFDIFQTSHYSVASSGQHTQSNPDSTMHLPYLRQRTTHWLWSFQALWSYEEKFDLLLQHMFISN